MHAKFSGFVRFCMVFFFLAILSGCVSMGYSAPPITVAEIVAWSQAGISPPEIIRRMQNAGDVYRLSASQLADLREQGVNNAVINYMQQTYLREQRLQGRFEGYGCCNSHFGFGSGYYGDGLWMGY